MQPSEIGMHAGEISCLIAIPRSRASSMNRPRCRMAPGGNVVEDHDAPVLALAVFERRFHPTVRLLPIARDAVPQHHGEAIFQEYVRGLRAEQMVAQQAAIAFGTKHAAVRADLIDQCLSPANFALDDLIEWLTAPTVPNATRLWFPIQCPAASTLCASGRPSAAQPLAKHKESGQNFLLLQHAENLRGNVGKRAVVESEGKRFRHGLRKALKHRREGRTRPR